MSDALKQTLDLSMFWEYRAILLQGLIFNALVFLCAASGALSVGLGAALLRVNRFWPMRWIGTLHVEVFRNAPDYIMLVWVHFVLPLLIGTLIRRRVEFHPFVSAVIATPRTEVERCATKVSPLASRMRVATWRTTSWER